MLANQDAKTIKVRTAKKKTTNMMENTTKTTIATKIVENMITISIAIKTVEKKIKVVIKMAEKRKTLRIVMENIMTRNMTAIEMAENKVIATKKGKNISKLLPPR